MTDYRIPISLLALFAISGCRSGGERRLLVAGPEIAASTPTRSHPYIVRMSDGVRDWEVEFPETTTGYEVRIPLRGGGGTDRGSGRIEHMGAPLTEADRELLSEMERADQSESRDGVFQATEDLIAEPSAEDGSEGSRGDSQRARAERAGPESEPGQQARPAQAPSYLLGIDEVRELYRSGNPEVAMVRLESLLRAYPDDTRLLAMKGTIWLRLGRPELARRAWEEVLMRDPDNQVVQQALIRLDEREYTSSPRGEEPSSEEGDE